MNSNPEGSKNESISNTPAACQPVGFIRFHGLTLLVVEMGGRQYVPAKPIVDLLGLDWRNQRKGIQNGDNAVLYGAQRLLAPVFDALERGDITPLPPSGNRADDENDTVIAPKNGERRPDLYIRLDRAQMFLARVNTTLVRSHGNIDAANYLLALQIEWAQALNAYQLHGVAVKQEVRVELKTLGDLMKMRDQATQYEKPGLTKLIANAMRELGCTVQVNPQGDLPLGRGAA